MKLEGSGKKECGAGCGERGGKEARYFVPTIYCVAVIKNPNAQFHCLGGMTVTETDLTPRGR